MSDDNDSTHEFDLKLICDYFSRVERQGPGSPEVTIKALSFIDDLAAVAKVADIGCGTGGQTRVLAEQTSAQITGLDLFPEFVALFNAESERRRLQDRVQALVGSMEKLPFRDHELDLIWSEGAIYNLGFERGINEWRRFLRPAGSIAVSEVSWLTVERPAEIDAFWNEAYPEIDLISRKVAQMEKAGYIPVAAFVLPENCWTTHFYDRQAAVQKQFIEDHAGHTAAEALVKTQREEARLYREYKDFFGYVFYIGRKA